MGNRNLLFAATLFLACGAVAAAFNPQPDPPGRHLNYAGNPNVQFEPPDPCLTRAMQMRKAGGTQMTGKVKPLACTSRGTSPNLHPLNPQPLPPG